MAGAQRACRIIDAGVDDFAVAGGNAITDPAGRFRHNDVVAVQRCGARNC